MMPDLGKYAVEVYSAYVISLALLAIILVISVRRYVRVRAELEKIERDG